MNLYLIDGNSYIYRAYYAIRELSNSKGFPTNALYGFTNMLFKILKEKQPDAIAISFDSPVPTERHKIYEDYKAQRPETPDDLLQQIPHIRRIVAAFCIPVFEIPGYEADDILGTIAKKASQQGMDVYIVTSDKDMLQIVDERVKIYDPMKDRMLDAEYVNGRYGILPGRISEFMALTGDPVDNIPGVKGVGQKTAKDLLTEFISIDDLLSNADRIKRHKLRTLIKDNADMIKLSKTLATLDTSVPLDVDFKAIHAKEPDWSLLLDLFREFEFGSLMRLIPRETGRERKCEIVLARERLEEIASCIDDHFAFDTETTGKNPMSSQLVGIAICHEKGSAFYIPVAHAYQGSPKQITKETLIQVLSRFFEDDKISKAGHNLKFDIMMLRQEGIRVNGYLYDTMIASYLLHPNKPVHSLEETALSHLSYRKKSFQEVLQKRGSFAEVPLEDAGPYSCDDAVLSFELQSILFKSLDEAALIKMYQDIEMPLIHVLADVESKGIKVDVEKLQEISKELEREIDGIERRVYFLAGEEFNINSPKQLSTVLFHNLGFKPGKKTKTGFSTQMAVLEELAATHELPREILTYRSLNKLKTTYIDILPTLVNPRTGRIHTSFNQAATATGRLSSSEPNLQNIPVRGEWGRRIREAFIAEKHNLLLSADYSQIELRILAHLSSDQGFIEAFRNGLDIHTRTASEIFGVPLDSVSPDLRRIAKTVNFGIIYGMSPFGLSAALNISMNDAKSYIDQYFARHPGIKRYMEKTISEAKEHGYVATLFGRKRAVPEVKSKNAAVRQQGERLAINSPIQGTAADMIKLAMTHIWSTLNASKLKTKMILQVHDELLFEVPGNELDQTVAIVKKGMEEAVSLSVPVSVGIYYGKNWSEAH